MHVPTHCSGFFMEKVRRGLMLKFILKRLGMTIVTLWVIVTVTFY